jgi:hypothetical protein
MIAATEAVARYEAASMIKPAAFTAAKTSPVVIAETAVITITETTVTEATEIPVAETPAFKAVESAEAIVVEPTETPVTEAPDKKTAPVIRIPMIEVIPGANSDEDSVREVVRAPVTIRRASIRIVRIKPVVANRGRIVETVIRADSDAHSDLALRIDRRHHH